MRDVHVGPELAHAARHQVGVAVEVGARLERGELALVLAGKDAQVLGLPSMMVSRSRARAPDRPRASPR